MLQKNQDHETKNNSINVPSLKYEYDKDAQKVFRRLILLPRFHGLREKKDFQHLNPELSKISGTEKLLFSDEKSDEVEQEALSTK